MELFALLVLLTSSFTRESVGLAVGGLVLWVLCDVLFGVYYYKVMRKD